MFAELVINIEAGLEGTFHYHVPADLQPRVQVGSLVEVEFGRQLAQGIVVNLEGTAPIRETKPVIALIDPLPVVRPWQIALARQMSAAYLAPLNACLRLMLPPGLTRWSDRTYALSPRWDGAERDLRTPAQSALVALLRDKGDLRGRQIERLLPAELRSKWQDAARQLVDRGIVAQGSVLDPPRLRPKKIATAELLTDPHTIRDAVLQLGRADKRADVLNYLALSDDPLPAETDVLAATGATAAHLQKLAQAGLVQRIPAKTVTIEGPDGPQQIEEPAVVGSAVRPKELLGHILALRGAGKQYAVLTHLAQAAQPVPLADLCAATGATRAQLNRLAELELIRFGAEQVWRDSLADKDFTPAEAPPLTRDQGAAWRRIKAAMQTAENAHRTSLRRATDEAALRPFLLHGVTGSGKTEIYMRAVAFALQHGRSAIVLVPEIALTPQTVRRFAARFPGRVAVLHSRLSDGERFDTWRRARLGLFDIIVGPRSALFTPLRDPGVVIVDEEHDESYKQSPPVPPPYYHAADTAVALARVAGAVVILGSATPDLVSYHRGMADEYQLLSLPKRVMGHRQRIADQAERVGRPAAFRPAEAGLDDALTIDLPPVSVVDMRQELRAGNRSVFSRLLQRELQGVLERQEQAILFLNRRGTASHVFCRDCGHTLHCPRCDTPLTFHRPNAHLICHTCGHHEPEPTRCPACGSPRIKYFGLGTEQLETLVQEQWPTARLVRWDRDTTAGRDAHEQLLAGFVRHEADILIGTQMIAKGLDLPLVTLVGVISADTTLNLPDFRTGERTFQILTQVSGRAGRGLLGGRVVVQTYQPEHYAIRAAAEHDYITFYLDEIRFRTQHRLPPFRRMAKLVFSDPNPQRAEEQARIVLRVLQHNVRTLDLSGADLIGPTPPFFDRIDRRYRRQIIIRSADPARILAGVSLPPGCTLDIDPVSTL